MMKEKKGKTKKAPAKKAAKAQIDDSPNTKIDKPMTEDKIEQQGVNWPKMMMGMWKDVPYFTTSSDVMEPFMQLAKSQQQHSKKLFSACVDFQLKLNKSGYSGDIQKVTEACLELSGEFFRTWQESIKEQTLAFYKFWQPPSPPLKQERQQSPLLLRKR
jgi:hypothetical protein